MGRQTGTCRNLFGSWQERSLTGAKGFYGRTRVDQDSESPGYCVKKLKVLLRRQCGPIQSEVGEVT